MFMITDTLLDKFKESKDKTEFWTAFLPQMVQDFKQNPSPSCESLYPNIEKVGAKLNFIHGSDWHLPFNPLRPEVRDGKCKDIIMAFKEISKTIKNAGGMVNGIISSGDYVNANEMSSCIPIPEECPDKRRLELEAEQSILWKENLQYASKMLQTASAEIGIEYSCNALVIPGNHDVVLRKNYLPDDTPFKKAFSCFVEPHCARNYLLENDRRSPEIPSCTMYCTCSGIVAFIGFTCTGLDSSDKRGCGFIGTHQTRRACEFIDILAKTPDFEDKPIVVIGVLHHHLANIVDARLSEREISARRKEVHTASDNTIFDARDFLETMSSKGMRLFVHGHQHTLLSYDLSYAPLSEKKKSEKLGDECNAPNSISCCSLPSTEKNSDGKYHLAILTIDFELGKIYYKPIEYNHHIEKIKADSPGRSFPIYSVSNVPCDERRLYRSVCNWLSLSQSSDPEKDYGEFSLLLKYEKGSKRLDRVKNRFDDAWKSKRVVDVCLGYSMKDEEPTLHDPDFFDNKCDSWSNSTSFYDLYAIFRDNQNCKSKYDLLMNFHAGIEAPVMSRWRCFLLPATKVASVASFLQILRWNVLHILHEEDMIENRASLESLVKELLGAERDCGMNSSIIPNTLATQKFYKISPTTGHPEILLYNIVQLPKFRSKDNGINRIIDKALEKIPTLNDFWKTGKRQGGEQRGLTWIPLDALFSNHDGNNLNSDPLALFPQRNADVWSFLKESVFEKKASRELKKKIHVTGKVTEEPRDEKLLVKEKSLQNLFTQIHDVRLRGNILPGEKCDLYSKENSCVALVTFTAGELKKMLSVVRPEVFEFSDANVQPFPNASGLYPAQNYVSAYGVERIAKLATSAESCAENANGEKVSFDIYTLKSYYEVWRDSTEEKDGIHLFDILPPVIEYSVEDSLGEIWLICDGIHRIYCAIENAKKKKEDEIALTAIAVWPKKSSVWQCAPYYAYPTTWESVRKTLNKPPTMYTKLHRVEKKDFCCEMEEHGVDPKFLHDPKNFYREFERKGSTETPFKMGTQGGE